MAGEFEGARYDFRASCTIRSRANDIPFRFTGTPARASRSFEATYGKFLEFFELPSHFASIGIIRTERFLPLLRLLARGNVY